MDKKALKIDFELVSLNEYINAERKNRFIAAKIKKEMTERCRESTKQAMEHGISFDFPCYLHFDWYVTNAKKDPDNIAFSKKFILDGFQEAGFLRNDNFKNILGFIDTFVIDRTLDHGYVVVECIKEKPI